MSVHYVSLSDLFPNKSRATLYRWRKKGLIPKPDLVVGNREFYREDKFGPPADDATKAQAQAEVHTA